MQKMDMEMERVSKVQESSGRKTRRGQANWSGGGSSHKVKNGPTSRVHMQEEKWREFTNLMNLGMNLEGYD